MSAHGKPKHSVFANIFYNCHTKSLTCLPFKNIKGADGGMQRQEVVTYNPSLFELAEDDSNFFDESSNMFLDDELESMLTTDRDTLKRPEGYNARNLGQLSFTGMNLNPLDIELNTPISEPLNSPLATHISGAGKRKRK